ncbi:unnamed protein product [Adineta steineri]|uniref:Uncharacterized protein n=1 Tax=Adineta steineri TaxID=433720 RepID=A0A816EV11_9BILA|nr:unnamed protein product [Adineta steineri]CAF1654217.1 unnamed protein product [Adineta steineri]
MIPEAVLHESSVTVKFGLKLENELIKNDIRSDNQSEKVMKMLSDNTDEQSDELYNLRFKQLCKENSSDDNADNNLQIDKKLRNYASLDNDAESKNFLEQHHEFISTA